MTVNVSLPKADLKPILTTSKSLAVGILASGAAAFIDQAIQHPSGGMLTALTTNPTYAALFSAFALIAHQYLEHYENAATPTPPGSLPTPTGFGVEFTSKV